MSQPRLLVSVRDAEEALAAAEGGADIIDVKEPLRGPLGRAEPETIHAIRGALSEAGRDSGPLSAALGELRDLPPVSEISPCFAGLKWVKIGLSRCEHHDWRTPWRQLHQECRRTQPACGLIAVVYADWSNCTAPSPEEIVDLALDADCPGVLFDTFEKNGRSLLDHLAPSDLQRWIVELHAASRFVALAGGIDRQQLPMLAELEPDVIAVRSAVCRGGRLGRVDAGRVLALRSAMKSPSGGFPAGRGSLEHVLPDDE